MRPALVAVALVLVTAGLAGACGGKVVIGVGGDAGGTGGSGGSGSSSSSATASSTTNASSSSTGTACADDGDCVACFGCAQGGVCAAQSNACLGDQDCADFAECTSSCQDLGPEKCFDLCNGKFPKGGSEYVAMVQCAACQTCPSSCTVAFSFYCPVF